MRNRFYLVYAVFASMIISSCEIDDMKGPDAQIYGDIVDAETGELVGQDIVNGSRIYYIEKGFENPSEQEMVFHADGSYRNNLMFSGDYEFRLYRGNYIPLDPLELTVVPGKNRVDFEVIPYIRIKDVSIKLIGNTVTASFKIQQMTGAAVDRIALFGHTDETVGNGVNIVSKVVPVGTQVLPTEMQTISMEIDPSAFNHRKWIYFRVGALSSAADGKYNYAPAVDIELP